MMEPAKNTRPVSGSNPRNVLESIQAFQGIAQSETGEADDCHCNDETSPIGDALTLLRISPETTHPGDEPVTDPIENPIESPNQIQQLADRLKQREIEFDQRTAHLEKDIRNWNQTVASQRAQYQTKLSQLQQQATQVRCQQLHLMQLQSNIVKSYQTATIAMETLFDANSDDPSTRAAIGSLKYEVSGRFDFIVRRWEHLLKLMQNNRHQSLAENNEYEITDGWTE